MNNIHKTLDSSAKTLLLSGYEKGLKNCMECLTGAANVKCFGAIGDGQSHPLSERFDSLAQAQWCYPHAQGLNEEIDWAAIQAAVNAEDSIFIPPGEYMLDSNSIKLDGAKHLVGVGTDATIIHYSGSKAAMQVNSGLGFTTEHWSISDLTVDCDKIGNYGIRLGQDTTSPHSANKGVLERLVLKGAVKAGLLLDYSQINIIRDVYCIRNDGHGCYVKLDGPISNTDTHFFGCSFRDNRRNGLYSDGGVGLSFFACTFELNDFEGVLLSKNSDIGTTRNWVLDRCYFERNNRNQPVRGNKGQLVIKSQQEEGVNGIWQHMEVRRCLFALLGDTTHNVIAGRCQLVIWYPETNATPIGRDLGTNEDHITIWDDSGPDISISNIGGWELGGGNAKIIFHRINREHDEEVYFNQNGNWIRVLSLTKNGIETDTDIEFTQPATGLVLSAPNGARYRIMVDNNGQVTAGGPL